MKNQPSTLTPGKERLERALAHQGLASRREAKALIRSGSVKVNGTVIKEPGYGVDLDRDRIEMNHDPRATKESVLVYKPRGFETNATRKGSKDAKTAFPRHAHLAPIGRLDKESEGLLILSNDGTLASTLTKSGSSVGKTYLVTTREPVSRDDIQRMADGIELDGVMTLPAQTKLVSKNSFSITLHEGRKHQIRRMCDACRLTIESLVRTHIGSIGIGSMKPGALRNLTREEIALLKHGK
jgi:23S rRNA pseudouridine2605 synthase